MNKCYICGESNTDGINKLDKHHCFGGTANRKLSEKYGLTVELCHSKCHQLEENAVHMNKDTAQRIHEYGQRKFMREQGVGIAEFVRIFGRNYLDEEW